MLRVSAIVVVIAYVAAASSPASAERLFGLTTLGTIVTFDSDTANVITSSGAIVGVGTGETLLGLDLRPANRTLYTLSSVGKLYAITGNSRGYTATAVETLTTALTGSNFGIDFNPVPDRLRVVSTSHQNLRINPDSAATLIDTAVTYPATPAADPNIVGVAYSNSRAGATTTTLYGLDAQTDSLVSFIAPNAGTLVNIGPLGFVIGSSSRIGFDISGGTSNAFMTRNDRLYALNLLTGRATRLGRVGGTEGPAIIGIAAASVPEPATWGMMIGGFLLIGKTLRRRRTVAA